MKVKVITLNSGGEARHGCKYLASMTPYGGAIDRFLREVSERIDRIPERLPFMPELGKLVLACARIP
jgi:hypothetical protein